MTTWILLAALALAVLAVLRRQAVEREAVRRLEDDARRALDEARRRGESMIEDARLKSEHLLLQLRSEHDQQTQKERAELQAIERRLLTREESIDVRTATLESRSAELMKQEQSLIARKEQL